MLSVRIRNLAVLLSVGALASVLPVHAYPVSTNETVEHANLLKGAPAYREFPDELELEANKAARGAKDRYRMNLIEWQSASPKNAYLLCIHAWGLSAREFDGFGGEMANRGFDTAAIDCRGFGVDRRKKGMKRIDFDGTTRDIARLLTSVRRKHPEKKIFVVGESMGGAMALKVGAEHPELVDGVICSAPAWQIFGVKKITMEGLVDQVFGEPGLAARSVASMATSKPELQERWFTDRTYRTNYSVPEAFDYYRLMRSTPRNATTIKDVPVLVIQGLSDRLSKPEASALIFKRLKTNASKQFAIVAGAEHLVLEENQLTDPVANFVEQWILDCMNKNNNGKPSLTPSVVVIDGGRIVPSAKQVEIKRLKALAGST